MCTIFFLHPTRDPPPSGTSVLPEFTDSRDRVAIGKGNGARVPWGLLET